ncbi:MAG TPA: hypothetical protein VF297_23940 [Pyrinomonadaceae bacterium]
MTSRLRHVDQLLGALQRWARSRPVLYRLTLGTRLLLAVGFIPTGTVKLLGRRFTSMSPESDIGGFFETLYRSGPYWRFLGLAQVAAGLLVLSRTTSALGALAFFAIMLNVFFITISYDFHGTPVVTGLMLLSTVYLLLWDYDRLRGLLGLGADGASEPPPEPRLKDTFERGAYVAGLVCGLALFSALRGLVVPQSWSMWLALGCLLSLLVALWRGLFRRGSAS